MKRTLILHSSSASRAKIPDLLNERYNTVEFGKLWFVDFSHLGNFWIFVVLEASSKRVIAYSLKESKGSRLKCPFNSGDCIMVYVNALTTSKPPEIIHSDNGGQFLTQKYISFLKSHNISQSMTDKVKFRFGNHVIERFFRTLKDLLSMYPNYAVLKRRIEMQDVLDIVMRDYNDRGHKALLGLSPNHMEDALTLYKPKDQEDLGITRTFSDLGADVEAVKSVVVQTYAGNWINFLMDWRKGLIKDISSEMAMQNMKQTEELKAHYCFEIDKLHSTLKQMKSAMGALEQRALELEAEKKLLEDKRRRRKERIRLPVRDAAGLRELTLAIDLIKESSQCALFFFLIKKKAKARDIVCLTLLFLTGLRVSNLLSLQCLHISQLLLDHKFDLALIKSRQSLVQSFYLPPSSIDFFESIKEYFEFVLKDKEQSSFIITEKGGLLPLHRVTLDKRLNSILKKVSKLCHKNLKTHSFRINLTTALIESVGIEMACRTIGHSDIRTTQMYNRRSLGLKELASIYNKAHKHISTLENQKLLSRKARAARKLASKLKKENNKKD